MFNGDFYPTPKAVIEQMTWGLDLHDKTVLEPSAGKGDIVDFCAGSGANVLAVEKEADLRRILSGKCRVIGEDFLKIERADVSHVNYIIMNPPFSADEHHILHAWDISPDGCQVIALCNAETIKNAYSRGRRTLSGIVKDYGTFDELGDVFSSAERATDVSIGLIKLFKPKGQTSDEFDGFFLDEEEEAQYEGLRQYSFVRDVVNRYVGAVRIFDKQLEAAAQMNELISGFFKSDISLSLKDGEVEITRDHHKKELQKSAWRHIFSKMNMHKYSTVGLREDINRFVEQQTNVPFTEKNVYQMIHIVIGTNSQRMDKALLEVFDELTHRYHENRYAVEGWKTNSHYLVNEKFILPYVAPQSRWVGRFDISSHATDKMDDLVKALCYLTGRDYNTNMRLYPFLSSNDGRWGEWMEWTFFEIKLFKKGTGHFKFKDRDVWAMFNQNVARIKGYPLPETVKSTSK